MNNDEIEPDMESDPTLASCCQRELKDRRVKQTKLDAVRSGMPASLVDKSLITSCCNSVSCICAEGSAARAEARAEYGAMTEAEIEAALNDADLDGEFEKLRVTRLQQLREESSWRKKPQHDKDNVAASVKRGMLSAVPAGAVLNLVYTGQPVVAILMPGNQTRDLRKAIAPADDVAMGIAGHMSALSQEFVGTIFLSVAIHDRQGDDLRHALSVSDLPAFVCMRSGVIVSIVMGARLRQFVQMGPVGSAILRAWLYEAKMLYESAEEARAVAGPTDEIRAEVEVRRARGRGGGTWMRRGGGLGEDDESDKSQESGESGGTSEEEEEEEGRSAFVGRTNNVAGSGRRRGGDRGMEEVTERLDVGRGGLGMGIGVVGDVPVVSRAQTSNRSQACAQIVFPPTHHRRRQEEALLAKQKASGRDRGV